MMLRVLVLSLVAAAWPARLASAQPGDLPEADRQEVARFVVTPDLLRKALDVNTNVVKLLTSDRTWRRQAAAQARSTRERSIAEAVARIEADARMVTLLQQARLEPRPYVVGQLALLQAVAAVDSVKGGLMRRPKKDAGAAAENFTFVETHAAEVQRFVDGVESNAALL